MKMRLFESKKWMPGRNCEERGKLERHKKSVAVIGRHPDKRITKRRLTRGASTENSSRK